MQIKAKPSLRCVVCCPFIPLTDSAQHSTKSALGGPLCQIQSRLLDLGAAIATPAQVRKREGGREGGREEERDVT